MSVGNSSGGSAFLGYHEADQERLSREAPPVVRLHISPSRLPAQISHLYIHRLYSRRELEARREKAFSAFGRPGRGLRTLAGAFDDLAETLGWGSQIRAQKLADAWPRIVGSPIALYTRVVSYRRGLLVVAVTDTAWTQILQSMEGVILEKVNAWMAPTHVDRLLFRDRHPRDAEGGRLRTPRKGLRRPTRVKRAEGRRQKGWRDPGAGSVTPPTSADRWG